MIIDRNKLQILQARIGLSRTELLKKSGVSTAAFNGLGVRDTTPKTVHRIAVALGCDVTDLLPDRKEG